jgi:hypothetical protein
MVFRRNVQLRVWQRSLALPLLLLAAPSLAIDSTLQVVDLSEKGMSTEGGEARLLRMANSNLGSCKIEVVHYGEMGRTTYRFMFDRALRYAARREYSYAEHFAASSRSKMTLRREVLLSSQEGARELPIAYVEYRGFFDPRKLALCNRTARR